MNATPHGNPRGVLSRWWRVSLRAKGVAVLAVPMAALFVALFTISWVETEVGEADAMVVRAYQMRGDLVDLRSWLLDAQTAVSGRLGPGNTVTERLRDRERMAMGNVQARVALLREYEERQFALAHYRRDLARRRLFRTVVVCGIAIGGAS